MMTPRRSSGCGACIPELTTRRHRGRLLCFVRQPSQSIHTSRETRTFRRRFRIPHISFRGLLSLLATQQIWYHHLQLVQSLIPHDYRQYRCTRQTVCSTHIHTPVLYVTELFTYEVLLYSSLYLLKCCCFDLNCGTVHPNIVHRNRKRALLSQSTFREELVEKSVTQLL